MTLNYDENADVLYIRFVDETPDLSRRPLVQYWDDEPEFSRIVRADAKTGEILGFTMLHFKHRIEKEIQQVLALYPELDPNVPRSK